jgi:hypothetical protein
LFLANGLLLFFTLVILQLYARSLRRREAASTTAAAPAGAG